MVIDEKEREHHIRLFPSMTAEQLRAKLDALDLLEPTGRSFFHADDANWNHYATLLGEIWPESSVFEGPSEDAGMYRVPGRIEFAVRRSL